MFCVYIICSSKSITRRFTFHDSDSKRIEAYTVPEQIFHLKNHLTKKLSESKLLLIPKISIDMLKVCVHTNKKGRDWGWLVLHSDVCTTEAALPCTRSALLCSALVWSKADMSTANHFSQGLYSILTLTFALAPTIVDIKVQQTLHPRR